MNTPLLPVGMDRSHTSTIHPTTISLSMFVSNMMPPKHLHPLRGGMSMQLLVLRISTLLKNPTKNISFRILTEIDNLQGLYPLKDEWIISCCLETRLVDQMKSSTTEVEMVKRLNGLNNQPEIG